jgi:hypothetical protein
VGWTSAGFSSLLHTLSGSKQGVVDICRVFRSAGLNPRPPARPPARAGEEMGWIYCTFVADLEGRMGQIDASFSMVGARWAISWDS